MIWKDKVGLFGFFFFTFYKIIYDRFIYPYLFVKLFNFGEIDFNDTEKLYVKQSLTC